MSTCPWHKIPHELVCSDSRSGVHFQDAALAFDGDDALFEGAEELAGVRDAAQVEVGRRVVVGEDFNRADGEDLFRKRLVELDVFDVPELKGVDGGGEPAALE